MGETRRRGCELGDGANSTPTATKTAAEIVTLEKKSCSLGIGEHGLRTVYWPMAEPW